MEDAYEPQLLTNLRKLRNGHGENAPQTVIEKMHHKLAEYKIKFPLVLARLTSVPNAIPKISPLDVMAVPKLAVRNEGLGLLSIEEYYKSLLAKHGMRTVDKKKKQSGYFQKHAETKDGRAWKKVPTGEETSY